MKFKEYNKLTTTKIIDVKTIRIKDNTKTTYLTIKIINRNIIDREINNKTKEIIDKRLIRKPNGKS